MSDILTDSEAAGAAPATGFRCSNAALTAETFGIPLAVLADSPSAAAAMPLLLHPGRARPRRQRVTTEEWKKVLSELAEIGVLQIRFSGGEPTARKDLVELVRHATDVGLYCDLITSAVLPTRENFPRSRTPGSVMCRSVFRATSPWSPTASPD